MKISTELAAKIGPDLKERLEAVTGETVLRAILTLRGEPENQESAEVDPRTFKNRTEYRKAAAAAQARKTEDDLKSAMVSLEKLQLQTKGGKMSPVVVVEGRADQVLRSIALDTVQHADSDQKIDLIRPE